MVFIFRESWLRVEGSGGGGDRWALAGEGLSESLVNRGRIETPYIPELDGWDMTIGSEARDVARGDVVLRGEDVGADVAPGLGRSG